MPQKHLDTLNHAYSGLKAAGLTNDQIMDILRFEASSLDPPPTAEQLDEYFDDKGLKQ